MGFPYLKRKKSLHKIKSQNKWAFLICLLFYEQKKKKKRKKEEKILSLKLIYERKRNDKIY